MFEDLPSACTETAIVPRSFRFSSNGLQQQSARRKQINGTKRKYLKAGNSASPTDILEFSSVHFQQRGRRKLAYHLQFNRKSNKFRRVPREG